MREYIFGQRCIQLSCKEKKAGLHGDTVGSNNKFVTFRHLVKKLRKDSSSC